MLAPVQVCIVLRLRNRVLWLVFNLHCSIDINLGKITNLIRRVCKIIVTFFVRISDYRGGHAPVNIDGIDWRGRGFWIII